MSHHTDDHADHKSDEASLAPQAGKEVRIPDGKYAIVCLDTRRPYAMKPRDYKNGDYYYIVAYERNEYAPEQWEVLWDAQLAAHSFRNVQSGTWMGVVANQFDRRPTLVVSYSPVHWRVQESTQNGAYYIVSTTLPGGLVADLARFGNNSEIICANLNGSGTDPWQQWQFVAIGK